MTTDRQWMRHLDREAEEFAEQVARALRRAIRAGTSDLGDVLTAQGAAEPAEPFVSLDDLAAIETAWRAEVNDNVIPAVARFMRAGADRALADLAVQAPVLLDMRHPAAELHLAQAENRLRGVGTDLWQRTRDELIVGFQAGESVPELSKRVRTVLASTEVRARAIARTEVISASNAGSITQMRLLGENAPTKKVWLATNDSRTRPTHHAADGETVALGEEFTVGGAHLDFPGDPTGPADEVVNCRCTIAWEFE